MYGLTLWSGYRENDLACLKQPGQNTLECVSHGRLVQCSVNMHSATGSFVVRADRRPLGLSTPRRGIGSPGVVRACMIRVRAVVTAPSRRTAIMPSHIRRIGAGTPGAQQPKAQPARHRTVHHRCALRMAVQVPRSPLRFVAKACPCRVLPQLPAPSSGVSVSTPTPGGRTRALRWLLGRRVSVCNQAPWSTGLSQ